MALTQISTAGVKDDAVTSGKIPANAVGSSELADNAVDTNAIQDDAVTADKIANSINTAIATNTAKTTNATHTGDVTGSTSLTLANSGVSAGSYGSATAIPAITVDSKGRITAASTNNVSIPAGTTINNNADNRVITGSGTANTLNGESNVVIDVNGRMVLGGAAGPFAIAGHSPALQLQGTEYNGATLGIINNANDATGAYLQFSKTRHGSNGGATIVQDNDMVGQLTFTAADGTDATSRVAEIKASVDGTPGSNDTPGRLTFLTTADGAQSTSERMRIDSSGQVLVGGTSLGAAGSFGIEPHGHVRSILASGTTGDTLFGAISGVSNGFQVGISGTNVQRYSFHNGSTVTARIDSDGLKFMNDTAAANALDDYEEGQYVPAPTGDQGQTNVSIYSNENTLNYTKIGNLVTVSGRIRMQNVAYSGGLRITLPFTAEGNTNTSNAMMSAVGTHGADFDSSAGTGSHMGMFFEIGGGTAYAYFLVTRDNSSWIGANNSIILANTYLSFSCTYRAA